jgi:hypothetical protein
MLASYRDSTGGSGTFKATPRRTTIQQAAFDRLSEAFEAMSRIDVKRTLGIAGGTWQVGGKFAYGVGFGKGVLLGRR